MKKLIGLLKKYCLSMIIFLLIGLVYFWISSTGMYGSYLFPPIEMIIQAFVNNIGLMFKNMLASFQLMIPSLIVALVIAIVVGTALGLNKTFRESIYPSIYSLSVIPSILMSPFALLLAPTFRWASVFMIVYNTIWGTLFATITGIATIDRRYLDNASTLEIKGAKRLFKIILPAASPSILSGFVNSLRGTFTVLVYAEMYGSEYGMGFFVKKYTDFGLYAEAIAGFVFMVVVLVTVMLIFEKIKDNILKWTLD